MGRNFVFGVSSEFYLLELGDKMVRSKNEKRNDVDETHLPANSNKRLVGIHRLNLGRLIGKLGFVDYITSMSANERRRIDTEAGRKRRNQQ